MFSCQGGWLDIPKLLWGSQTIPCSYGLVKPAGVGPIPPNATLMFDLELLEAPFRVKVD